MASFNPSSGAAQTWVAGDRVEPFALPQPTIRGQVSYTVVGLPEGVEINLDTLVVYGSPANEGSGTFRLIATDQDGEGIYEFGWTVIPYEEPILWDIPDPLNVVIGQPVDYQLPQPIGGTPPYSFTIVQPPAAGAVIVGERRLPAGVTLSDAGLFSGTPTDTPDNRGGVWVDVTFDMRFIYQNGGRRILRQITLPPVSGSRAPVYDGTTYGNVDFVTRTRPLDTQAEAEVADGGLRMNAGGLFLRTPHIQNNPYVRLTNVRDGRDRKLTWGASPGGNSRWPILTGLSPGSVTGTPNANDLYITGQGPDPTSGRTPQRVRVRIGSDTAYQLVLEATDSLGAAVRQTLQVQVSQADPLVAVPVLDAPVVLAHTASVNLLDGVQFDGEMEYSLTDRGELPNRWRQSEQRGNITVHHLTYSTDYNLWARNRGPQDQIGRAVLAQFTTPESGESFQPPPPANLTVEEEDGQLRLRCDTAAFETRVSSYDYKVTLASAGVDDGVWRPYPASTSATSVFLVPGLRNHTEYRIGLRARNLLGGPGLPSYIRGIPQEREVLGPPSKIQVQVLIDLVRPGEDPSGIAWYDLADRVRGLYWETGRVPRQFITQTGVAVVDVETKDDFINIEGSSPYRIDSLRDRQVFINEVLETAGGTLRRRTVFAGIVESAKPIYQGDFAYIRLQIVDLLGLMAQEEVIITETIPAQTTGERIKWLLGRAGWSSLNPNDLRYYNPSLIAEGSKHCSLLNASPTAPITYNLLEEINLLAESEGGRLYVETGGDNIPGSLRFVSASPVTEVDGRLLYGGSLSPAVLEMSSQPQLEAEDSNLYNDFEMDFPNSELEGGPIRVSDQVSILEWGKRSYSRTVRTDRTSTEGLARALLKRYKVPRKNIGAVELQAHFQHPTAAATLQSLDLGRSLITEFLPPGARTPVENTQRVDGLQVSYAQLDRQYVEKRVKLRLLLPESEVYWILNEEGADRYDSDQTFAAPRRDLDPRLGAPGGRLKGGWRVSDDKEYQVVSANRADGFLFQQALPRYESETERDLYETAPLDGHACVLVETSAADVRSFWLYEYSGADFQWLRRAQLTSADANPTTRTFIVGSATAGIIGRGTGNVLAAGTAATDLRS